jgi:flagellar biosynthesis/type III secretory pathway ATPase
VDKVTVSNIADSKPSFVVSAEAAATLTIGAGELAIYMGTNVKDINNQRVVSAFKDLRDRFREAEYPVGPLAANISSGEPPSAEGYAVSNAATIPALTEDDAVIAYGATFYDAGNSSNIGNIIDRAIEVFREQILNTN